MHGAQKECSVELSGSELLNWQKQLT